MKQYLFEFVHSDLTSKVIHDNNNYYLCFQVQNCIENYQKSEKDKTRRLRRQEWLKTNRVNVKRSKPVVIKDQRCVYYDERTSMHVYSVASFGVPMRIRRLYDNFYCTVYGVVI